jgi:hypothetical protein
VRAKKTGNYSRFLATRFMVSMKRIPVEVVFHVNWWNKNFGFTFDKNFFFEPGRRVTDEQKMRSLLYKRFGDLGLGEKILQLDLL